MIKMSTKAGEVSNWWKTMKVILTHTHNFKLFSNRGH